MVLWDGMARYDCVTTFMGGEVSGIEQDADVIAFLYREEYYLQDKTPEDKLGTAELIVAKHRNGPTGVVNLRFFNNITRFENLSTHTMTLSSFFNAWARVRPLGNFFGDKFM